MVHRTIRKRLGRRHPRTDEIYPQIRRWTRDGLEEGGEAKREDVKGRERGSAGTDREEPEES